MTRIVNDPRRWAGQLRGMAHWATFVDWTNDGGATWLTFPRFFAGSVNCDTTATTRWTTSDLKVGGVPVNEQARRTEDGINPGRTRFKIRHGLWYGRNTYDLIGMGVYRCSQAVVDDRARDTLTLTGASFESYLQSPLGAFPKPRQFQATSAQALVAKLIHEILPDAVILWDPSLDPGSPTPLLQSDDDRWALIDGNSESASIARAVGARIFTDGDGGWRVRVPGSLADPITWTSTREESQLSSSRTLSTDGVFNMISLTSSSTDGTTPTLGPVIVLDDDPASLTYARLSPDRGGFGPSVRKYSSPLFTSTTQMVRAGQSMLAQTLGRKQSFTFTRRYDPRIEPWEVGLIDSDVGPVRTILDSLTYDLTGKSPLSGEARTTSSQYAGQVGEWVDTTEGGATT